MDNIKTKQNNYHPDPRNEIEKFLHKRIPFIIKAYGLGDIKFNFLTVEESDELPEEGVMNINYDPIYNMAFILVAPNALQLFKNREYKTISDSLVHEVGHIVTKRLEDLAKNRHSTMKDINDTVEQTTETIARIVINLLSKVEPGIF